MKAAILTDPSSAVSRQVGDIATLGSRADLKFAEALADDAAALAVTTPLTDDRDRKGVLLIDLWRPTGLMSCCNLSSRNTPHTMVGLLRLHVLSFVVLFQSVRRLGAGAAA